MQRAALVLAALLVVALTGCARSASPTVPTQTELVDYTRQGGLLGTDDHLIVLDTGSASLTRRGAGNTFTVDNALLVRLRGQLAAADFDRLDSEYGPAFGCCDQFTHRVRHRGRLVRSLDDTAPERLRAVLSTLAEIIASGSR
jgi:hypothetical protein